MGGLAWFACPLMSQMAPRPQRGGRLFVLAEESSLNPIPPTKGLARAWRKKQKQSNLTYSLSSYIQEEGESEVTYTYGGFWKGAPGPPPH
jgi:hypothetical protein